MLNPDYSLYECFVEVIKELLPRLPDIVQNHYCQLVNENTYGTPKEPKAGLIFKYTRKTNVKQEVTPLIIMIKCVATLYHAMHNLGPFHSHFELKWQMRTCATSFIGNERDAICILHFMIEDPRWFEVEATALEQEFNMTLSKGGNVVQDSTMDEASDLEEELDVALSKGGDVIQDSKMDEASDVVQTLATTSKLNVALTTREFTFDPTAVAGDGLIITGLNFVDAVAGHHGPPTSSSAASHLTSVDVNFSIKIDDQCLFNTPEGQPLPKPPEGKPALIGGFPCSLRIGKIVGHTPALAGAPDEQRPMAWQPLLGHRFASTPTVNNAWRRNCIKNTYDARKSMTSKALRSAHETYGDGEMDHHLYTAVATMNTDAQWKLPGPLPVFDPPRPNTTTIIAKAQLLSTSVKVLSGDAVTIDKETLTRLALGTKVYSTAMTDDDASDALSCKNANCSITVKGASDATCLAAGPSSTKTACQDRHLSHGPFHAVHFSRNGKLLVPMTTDLVLWVVSPGSSHNLSESDNRASEAHQDAPTIKFPFRPMNNESTPAETSANTGGIGGSGIRAVQRCHDNTIALAFNDKEKTFVDDMGDVLRGLQVVEVACGIICTLMEDVIGAGCAGGRKKLKSYEGDVRGRVPKT
ncbi:uncharacterized protein UHO2_00416 [Ustilago hordei]|uniref:uncharacterized protein n=1 Tax=Ustilago hordei TaxID=120017 RepID=UPI001A44F511|nr:uncharacterized protein UHO2_00416 [Ustilago hordei]SYW81923.1 uncharacterized protein UHO2_00416 [Ustilago hordei]